MISNCLTSVFAACVLVLGISAQPAKAGTALVKDLKCEYRSNLLGMDVQQPRLSWRIETGDRGWLQSAYQIQVAQSPGALNQGTPLTWDSGKTSSRESLHRGYAGPELKSSIRYYWHVRVWDAQGQPTPWSDAAWWEMGLLKPQDWQASWIQPAIEEDISKSNPSPMLRKEFDVRGEVKSARLYVTSRGLYEMYINGQRVGDQVLTPGWTSYDDHIQYQVYDVASQLKKGRNAAGAILGDGWYRGNLGFRGQRNVYGDKLALLAQLQIQYADGTSQNVVSDQSWKAATGPILAADIYNGEIYDARLEKKGWSEASYDESGWKEVKLAAYAKNNLVAPVGPPVLRIQELPAVRVLQTPAGETVVDMGQNMVGWVRLKVSGSAGTTVTLQHAEVLDKEGNFYTENLRAAKQTVTYTLKGGGVEVFEPRFTFMGFRFLKVQGFPVPPTVDNFTGVVVHSDITPAGTFECSNPMINELQHNIQWGQKGNFVDVPTDCPQRDERLGWTGDAQAFARTASFIADVAAFYTKWLKDVAADQKPSGAVPHVIPDVLNRKDPKGEAASAGWADAAVIVPWTVYLSYGDTRILERQYGSMKAWVDYMTAQGGEACFWNNDFTYGDWLAYATTRSDYPGATTDKDLIMQAYFARSTDLLQRIASLLGKSEDAVKYAGLLAKIKKVFNGEFVTPNGRLSSNTQTAYALALAFDLLPENQRPQAAERLAENVREFKHITTGFLGTPVICHVLSSYGYFDEAFMLLNRKEYPSWLYPITKGATTIWERWDGIKPDGSFQDKGMNSFNHYAYGAIGEWLYRVVAGIEIDPQQPGYRHIIIQPHPGGGMTYAKAHHKSLYGPVASNWSLQDGRFLLEVELPPNTTATISLPQTSLEKVTEGRKPLREAAGILRSSQKGRIAEIEVGSGSYQFSCPIEP